MADLWLLLFIYFFLWFLIDQARAFQTCHHILYALIHCDKRLLIVKIILEMQTQLFVLGEMLSFCLTPWRSGAVLHEHVRPLGRDDEEQRVR